eukprot:NODE_70_length_23697_cov_0.294771.p11 type:complete len:157 gc:universal NODE_70_length_23697_cov_0.294771:6683-7153(+)
MFAFWIIPNLISFNSLCFCKSRTSPITASFVDPLSDPSLLSLFSESRSISVGRLFGLLLVALNVCLVSLCIWVLTCFLSLILEAINRSCLATGFFKLILYWPDACMASSSCSRANNFFSISASTKSATFLPSMISGIWSYFQSSISNMYFLFKSTL